MHVLGRYPEVFCHGWHGRKIDTRCKLSHGNEQDHHCKNDCCALNDHVRVSRIEKDLRVPEKIISVITVLHGARGHIKRQASTMSRSCRKRGRVIRTQMSPLGPREAHDKSCEFLCISPDLRSCKNIIQTGLVRIMISDNFADHMDMTSGGTVLVFTTMLQVVYSYERTLL